MYHIYIYIYIYIYIHIYTHTISWLNPSTESPATAALGALGEAPSCDTAGASLPPCLEPLSPRGTRPYRLSDGALGARDRPVLRDGDRHVLLDFMEDLSKPCRFYNWIWQQKGEHVGLNYAEYRNGGLNYPKW